MGKLTLRVRIRLWLIEVRFRLRSALPLRRCVECGRCFLSRWPNDEICSIRCANDAMAAIKRDVEEVDSELDVSREWLTRN